MIDRPIIAISTGDPSGIGPEISIKALKHKEMYEICRPFLIGDRTVFSDMDGSALSINPVHHVEDMAFRFGTVDLLDLDLLASRPPVGVVNEKSGDAAFQYVKKAIELAQSIH